MVVQPRTLATCVSSSMLAAIDRVDHHAVILEIDVPSYRTNAGRQRGETAAAQANAAPPRR